MKIIFLSISVLVTSVLSAGVFSFEPEGQHPVAKDGARIYIGGNMNGLGDYFSIYLPAWIDMTAEQRRVKLFKSFSVAHSMDNAKFLPTTLKEVKPDIVAMVLGVDALYYGIGDEPRARFWKSMSDMAEACQKAGVSFVILSLPAKSGSKAEDESNRKISVYAGDMSRFAKERGLCFFDFHRATLEFTSDTFGGNINQLRTAKAMADLFGLRLAYPHLAVDFAAGTAAIDAPNSVVVKGSGQYEVMSPRPPLGFVYCGAEAAEWTGFQIKAANLPDGVEKVKIGWTGRSETVSRAALEQGVNLMALSPGWTPYRNATLAAMKAVGRPAWNQLVLTDRLPTFERKLAAMEPGRDRTAFLDELRAEIYAGVDRDFDAANDVKPVTFVLTLTLL